MADEELSYVKSADWGDSLDGDGNIKNQVAFFDQIQKTLEQINAEEQKRLNAGDIYLSILEDQEAAIKRQTDKELKDRKEIMEIQLKIDKLKTATVATTAKEEKARQKQIKDLEKILRIRKDIQNIEKNTQEIVDKYQAKLDAKEELAEARKKARESGSKILKDGLSDLDLGEMKDGLKLWLSGGQSFDNKQASFVKGLDTMVSAIADLGKKLDKTIEEVVKYKSDWDTRLFGSDKSHSSVTEAIRDAVGTSPFVKMSDIMKNLDAAIEKGIAYNVEQRAFLQTVKDDIAATFDAFDATLLQIVRVQQSDSTAARMGMEASLNAFLNSMYSSTEYLSDVSDSVTSALYEATSLLSSEASIGFEYQIQKWLGSLYSVGMDKGTVSSIATAIGQMMSGDISGTSTGAGKLLTMSAARAGLSYSDILTKGINESDLNDLLATMVEYLAEISNSNKVVQTQYASVFGLKTSDIRAATNLYDSIGTISGYGMNYGAAVGALNTMAQTIGSRLSLGEMLENINNNFEYTMAAGIADNPGLYALWKISGMLDQYMGGINIPAISVMGNMVDLETTVADLMRVGAMSASLLTGIGGIVSGLGDALTGQGLTGALSRLGVSGSAGSVTKGGGLNVPGLGTTVSSKNFIGNQNGDDMYDALMQDAENKKNEISPEEEQDTTKLKDIKQSIEDIYELLAMGVLTVRFSDALPNDMTEGDRT